VVFYIAVFFVGCLLLLLVQPEPFEDVLFETASALGTVGLTRGLTPNLTPLGKCFIIVLMFIGRLGPITFGLALFSGKSSLPRKDDLAV
jgi:trk system potassium uptake protein TrkH